MGDNGWINRRLTYIKDCQKNIEKQARGGKSNITPLAVTAIDQEQVESDLECLKRLVIRNCNITDAIEKLNSTRKYRKVLMANTQTDLRQKFPFFLSNPDLVGFFSNCYHMIRHIQVRLSNNEILLNDLQVLLDYEEEFRAHSSSDTFVRMWPNYANPMRKFCNKKYECEKHTEWNEDIENFLLLMKALPSAQRGKKQPFKDMIEKLIVFKVVRLTMKIQ